jgi:hypothetical protein
VASGILRRLGQGRPLRSAIYRAISAESTIIAYWPCEDGSGSTTFASAIHGHPPGVPVPNAAGVTFAGDSDFPGSDPLATVADGCQLSFVIPPYDTSAQRVAWRYAIRLPRSVTGGTPIGHLLTTGTVAHWQLQVEPGTPDVIKMAGFNSASVEIVNDTSPQPFTIDPGEEPYPQPLWVNVDVWQDGSDVRWGYVVQHGAQGAGNGGVVAAAALGRAHGAVLNVNSSSDGMSFGHLAIGDNILFAAEAASASTGWSPEEDSRRVSRLAAEESLTEYFVPVTSLQETVDNSIYMGQQRTTDFLSLIQECRDAGQALMWETAGGLVFFLTRLARYNRPVDLELDWDQQHLAALTPAEDDQQLRNDMTVRRVDGGSARYQHPSVDPTSDDYDASTPVYSGQATIDLDADTTLPFHAQWRVHLGTVDEPRYPQLGIDLHRHTGLQQYVAVFAPGARVRVLNPPAELGPNPIDVYVLGVQEFLDPKQWTVFWNCAPASPWDVYEVEDATLGRIGPVGASLSAGVNSSATSLSVATPSGYPLWTTGSDVQRLTDAFDDRTVSSGWGTSDDGSSWSTSGGSASDYSVSAGAGLHSVGAVNSVRSTVIGSSIVDSYVHWSVSTAVLATGAPINVALMTRRSDANNYYFFTVGFTTGAAVTATITKRVASVETTLVSAFTVPGLTHTADAVFHVVCETVGTTLRMRVWAGLDEPADLWHVSVTDAALASGGSIGLRSLLTTGNTNTLPVVVSYDDLSRVTDFPMDIEVGGERMTVTAISGSSSPQTFTVARGVNGVVKSHSSAAAVELWRPGVWAL